MKAFLSGVAGAILGITAAHAQPAPKYAYEGIWAATAKDCTDEDGVSRMSIESAGTRFFWYETRCTASAIKTDGDKAWSMRMACIGDEGEKFSAQPKLSLPTPDRLVIARSPMGRKKDDVYVRCDPKKVPRYDDKGQMKKGG